MIQRLKQIPIVVHAVYFLLAVTFCFIYFQKIVSGADFNGATGLNAVASLETYKPYQFRLLLPFVSKLLFLIPLSQKFLFIALSCAVVYLLLVVYNAVINEYFPNTRLNLFLAPFILYPMVWNFIILNQTFSFYDLTCVLFFTLGFYFIIKDNFKWLLISFIIALVNKESAIYLAFSYLLFNYKNIFTKKIIFNASVLGIIFIVYKIALAYIFRNNPGGNYEVGLYANIQHIKELTTNRIYLKSIIFNLGLLYIFAVLLFVTGRWKLFKNTSLLYTNLTIIPFIVIGIYTIYFVEVRVYAETLPLFTNLFLIYLSTFDKLGFNKQT